MARAYAYNKFGQGETRPLLGAAEAAPLVLLPAGGWVVALKTLRR